MPKIKPSKPKARKVDLRRLPLSKRPAPSTGQSAESRELRVGLLSGDERSVMLLLDGRGAQRFERSIAYLADGIAGEQTRLRVRNALRRLVSCGWVRRVRRGTYQVTDLGRERFKGDR